MDKSIDSIESTSQIQNTYQSNSQSRKKIGNQKVSSINQQAIETLLSRIEGKQPMNSSNMSFNLYPNNSKYQSLDSKNKNLKMKKTILASINSQEFNSSGLNSGLNTSKLKLQSKEIMQKMPLTDLQKSLISDNSSKIVTHLNSKINSPRKDKDY